MVRQRFECWKKIVQHKEQAEQQSVTAASPLMVVGAEEAEPGMAALQKIPDRAGLEENLGRLYSEICGARPASPSADDKRSHGCKRAGGRTCTVRQEGWNTSWNTGPPGGARLTTATK
jgi:hypothetical protein